MSDGKSYTGQQYDPRFDMVYPFVQTMRDLHDDAALRVTGLEGQEATDLSPKDHSATMERKYNKSAINTNRAEYFVHYPKRVSVDLPNETTGLVSVVNKTEGAGEDLHPVSQQATAFTVFGDNGSGQLSGNPRAIANGSASVQLSVGPTIKRFPRVVTGTVYEIFLNGNFTEADIRAKISAGIAGVPVQAWPVFVERSETLILRGQQVSLSAKADSDAQAGGGISGGSPAYIYASYQFGQGKNREFGISNTILQLPPSIHGTLTITPNTDTATATVQAQADMGDLVIGGTTAVPAFDNDTGVVTETVTADVSPTSLSATPVASVPVTGLYLYDYSIDNSVGYGDTFITAVVIDMSIFA